MAVWDDDMPQQEYDLDRHAEEVGARMVSRVPCPVCGELMRVDDPTDYHEEGAHHSGSEYEEGGESG